MFGICTCTVSPTKGSTAGFPSFYAPVLFRVRVWARFRAMVRARVRFRLSFSVRARVRARVRLRVRVLLNSHQHWGI